MDLNTNWESLTTTSLLNEQQEQPKQQEQQEQQEQPKQPKQQQQEQQEQWPALRLSSPTNTLYPYARAFCCTTGQRTSTSISAHPSA